jgi:predicted phosphoribosyltransferase
VKNTNRGDRDVAVKNKNIILVDDGIATGNTL